MVTFGGLCNLERSIKRCRILQPFYNSTTTGSISMEVASFDEQYRISLAVLNMVISISMEAASFDEQYRISLAVLNMVTLTNIGEMTTKVTVG